MNPVTEDVVRRERHRNRGGRRALPGLPPAGLLALAALVAALPARAHDLWLVPSSFRPAAGEPVSVRVLVGHDPASAEPLPYRPGWVERFVWAEAGGGAGDLRGTPGRDPAGWARFEAPGVYALGLVSGATGHTMDVPGFERYLAEEGLEAMARVRAGAVYADGEVREAFSRSVKSLVRVVGHGTGSDPRGVAGLDAPADLILGLPLELVPLDDPFAGGDRTLRLRVLLDGEPAAGVRVDLRRLDLGRDDPAHAASGADGVVTFDLPGDATRHLVAATVLVPPEPGSDAEWHSLWTSLTFERTAG